MKYSLLVWATLLLWSCGSKQQEKAEEKAPADPQTLSLTEAQYNNAGIETGTLSTRSVSPLLKLSGKIDVPPQSLLTVSAPLGGYLKSTKLLPGMAVRKGEVLAVMEDVQYIQLQQDYLTAKAQMGYLESEYQRQRELNQNQASSNKVFEQARTALQSQRVLIKGLEQKLQLIGLAPGRITAENLSRQISLRSPINGFVSAVRVNTGKYASPSDVLFELVDPSDIHLNLTVYEKDLDKLKIGQRLSAFTNNRPEIRYPASIILISQGLNSENATEVHCHFERYDRALLPGMFMNAELELDSRSTVVLPDEAIVRFENRNYVFEALPNRSFRMLEVQTGERENGFTEVSGMEQDDRRLFAVKGAYQLLMALKNTGEE